MEGPRAEKLPVVVLGAGLTGMSASLALTEARIGHRLFERQRWVGGHVVTVEENGYRFDRTGHLLHLRDQTIRDQVLDWLGPDVVHVERRSRVFSHGVTTRYPFQSNTYGLPPDVAYECVLGFVQAQIASRAATPPRNFEEYCLTHFGPGFSKHFMIPYNERLWGVHPREFTGAWCQRFVPLPRLEDVIAGAVGKPGPELGYNASFVYPKRGIGELSRAMGQRLAGVELGRAPERIDLRRRVVHLGGEAVGFDALVNTAPLPAFLDLIEELPDSVLEARRRLRCTHLYYLDVALNAPSGNDAHWVYVPEAKYPFYRVGCYSHFSEAMAPRGKANLYVELADRTEPVLERLVPEVAAGLCELSFISRAEDIAFVRLRKLDHAYVIYDHAHAEALATIQAFLDSERLVSTGRYGGWNYSSMEDALVFGREAAEKARDLLR
jgi:protoporphyrinogen oxidase